MKFIFLFLMFFLGISSLFPSIIFSKERSVYQENLSKEIYVGMSQPEVALDLGFPSSFKTMPNGKEEWIYEKIAAQLSYGEYQIESADKRFKKVPALSFIKTSSSLKRPFLKVFTIIIRFSSEKRVESFAAQS